MVNYLNSDFFCPYMTFKAGPKELLHEIGKGGYSTVYNGVGLKDDRLVEYALKRYDPTDSGIWAAQSEFDIYQEIIRIPEYTRFFPELLEAKLEKEKDIYELYLSFEPNQNPETMSDRERIQYLYNAAISLYVLHKHEIIHADITTHNILGDGKLSDFGIAVDLNGKNSALAKRDHNNSLVGSLGYIAPETLKFSYVTTWSDLYMFSSVVYEILLDRELYDGFSATQVRLFKEDEEKYNRFLDAILLDDISGIYGERIGSIVKSGLSYHAEDRPFEISEYINVFSEYL